LQVSDFYSAFHILHSAIKTYTPIPFLSTPSPLTLLGERIEMKRFGNDYANCLKMLHMVPRENGFLQHSSIHRISKHAAQIESKKDVEV
jgi:hypothetical protein